MRKAATAALQDTVKAEVSGRGDRTRNGRLSLPLHGQELEEIERQLSSRVLLGEKAEDLPLQIGVGALRVHSTHDRLHQVDDRVWNVARDKIASEEVWHEHPVEVTLEDGEQTADPNSPLPHKRPPHYSSGGAGRCPVMGRDPAHRAGKILGTQKELQQGCRRR